MSLLNASEPDATTGGPSIPGGRGRLGRRPRLAVASGTRMYRVAQLDVAAAGLPVHVVIGPVNADVVAHAADILNHMAAKGPAYRIGLLPSPVNRRWTFTPNPGVLMPPTRRTAGPNTPAEILTEAAAVPMRVPISLAHTGEYLCLSVDHGIGDSLVLMELLAALTHGNPGNGFVEPVPTTSTKRPLFWALLNVVKHHPGSSIRQVAKIGQDLLLRLRNPRASGETPTTSNPVTGVAPEAPVVAFAKSDAHLIESVRAYRDRAHPGTSVTAIIIRAIYRAIQRCGVPLRDDLKVVVDLRPALPAGSSSLSNFFAVIRPRIDADMSVSSFGAALKAEKQSYEPVIRLAAALGWRWVATILGGSPTNRHSTAPQSDPSAITLTVSDLSKAPSAAKFLLSRPSDVEFAVALPPADRSHIAVAVWIAQTGAVQITATFYRSHICELRVQKALEGALSAISDDSRSDAAGSGDSGSVDP